MTKKPRHGSIVKKPSHAESKLYSHFRQLGRISDHVPMFLQNKGGVYFVTASVGPCFQIYDVDSLNLLFISDDLVSNIECIAGKDDFTFASSRFNIYTFERAKKRSKFKAENIVTQMLVLGTYLLALTESSLIVLSMSEKGELSLVETIRLEGSATYLVHPSTYLNKVLVGFNDGSMQLWNIRSCKLIYTFKKDEPVVCLCQSPVVDVVAVATQSGIVSLVDLRKDQQLFQVKSNEPISSISFRTDSDAHQMCVCTTSGTISVWSLETRRVDYVIAAHQGLAHASFIPGQPIILSCGSDNSIREFILEKRNSGFHLLRSRIGHSRPPAILSFYGSDGKRLLSGGEDRSFRLNSLIKDSQSYELSQGAVQAKASRSNVSAEELLLPPVVAMACFDQKDLKWGSVVTAHRDSNCARAWRVDLKAIVPDLKLVSLDKKPVVAVAISPCGHFAIIGSAAGAIDVYGLQSGILKKSLCISQKIAGIHVEQASEKFYVVDSLGRLYMANLKSGKIVQKHQILLDTGATAFATAYHGDADMLAVADDSHCITVFDCSSTKVVRRFLGHKDRILQVKFSSSAHWIISAGSDRTIRTWDMSTGTLIDILNLKSIPVSVELSPTDDMLATCQKDSVAIDLWFNKTVFSNVSVAPYSLTSSAACPWLQKDLDIAQDAIRLSSTLSKWKTLLHYGNIRSRNKPIVQNELPPKTPFFLDALVINPEKDNKEIRQNDQVRAASPVRLWTLLQDDKNSVQDITASLLTMGVSQLDFELESLPLDDTVTHLHRFFAFIRKALGSKNNYDMIQTCWNVFLRTHQELLIRHRDELAEQLGEINELIESQWCNLAEMMRKSLCLTSFIRSI